MGVVGFAESGFADIEIEKMTVIIGARLHDIAGRKAMGDDPGESVIDGSAGDAVDDDNSTAGLGDELDLDGRIDWDGGGLALALNELAGEGGLLECRLINFAEDGLDFRAAALGPGGTEVAAETKFFFRHAA